MLGSHSWLQNEPLALELVQRFSDHRMKCGPCLLLYLGSCKSSVVILSEGTSGGCGWRGQAAVPPACAVPQVTVLATR